MGVGCQVSYRVPLRCPEIKKKKDISSRGEEEESDNEGRNKEEDEYEDIMVY